LKVNPVSMAPKNLWLGISQKNTLVGSYKMPDAIASYKASFLNDLMIDNLNGFIYIADSGIFSDPLEGGIIGFPIWKQRSIAGGIASACKCSRCARILVRDCGQKDLKDRPMRTGADGIALSADRKTLYWCPLTARNLYGVDTSCCKISVPPMKKSKKAVRDFGDKGTNTDGMCADNQGWSITPCWKGRG